MASKPAIVLIPGSFTTASMYYPLQDVLAATGHEAYVHGLPSASRHAPEAPASLADDARFVGGIIETLADKGKDVVVVAHSYGGMVACEAARNLGKADRATKGQPGGIVRIVFLAAIVLPEGQSVTDHQGTPPASIVATDEFGFMRLASPAFSASRMYDGWPEERALAWASAAPRHSALSFASPLSYVAYKDMPSSYILTERDGIIPPAVQEMYIDNIKTLTGKPVDVHKLDTNHAPNLTAPEDLAKVIVEIAAAS